MRLTWNIIHDFTLECRTNLARGIWGPVKTCFCFTRRQQIHSQKTCHRRSLDCSMVGLEGFALEFLRRQAYFHPTHWILKLFSLEFVAHRHASEIPHTPAWGCRGWVRVLLGELSGWGGRSPSPAPLGLKGARGVMLYFERKGALHSSPPSAYVTGLLSSTPNFFTSFYPSLVNFLSTSYI